MASISSNPETTAIWQDWMVGDAGIEPGVSCRFQNYPYVVDTLRY
jgi:hypothetical protein